jgi:hypothetical protein
MKAGAERAGEGQARLHGAELRIARSSLEFLSFGGFIKYLGE